MILLISITIIRGGFFENKDIVLKKANKLGAKTWICIIIFGLAGQLAWMVENMYFSAFIQANITKESWATSLAVALSAIVAAVTTIFGGALSDRLGKRKVFVSWGYIIWGIVTALFALFGYSFNLNYKEF